MSTDNDLLDDIVDTIPASVQHDVTTIKESEVVVLQNTDAFSWSPID